MASISADFPLALIFPLTRHGLVNPCAGCAALRAPIPTGRDTLIVPSNCGSPAANGERPVCFDAERAIHGIDIDVQLERALIAQTAERNTIRIKLAGDGDGALAFHRAQQANAPLR